MTFFEQFCLQMIVETDLQVISVGLVTLFFRNWSASESNGFCFFSNTTVRLCAKWKEKNSCSLQPAVKNATPGL